MKKLLIVGDSLAGGLPHLSYPAYLTKMLPNHEITARGVGGDTLAGVSARMQLLLPREKPEVAIMEVGGNDVMLPRMKAQGGKWKWLAERIEKRGSIPAAGIKAFQDVYSETIGRIKQEVPEIIITTIPCLGEDLETERNGIRSEYNATIREVAEEHGVRLADTGKAFEEILAGVDKPSGFFQKRFKDAFLDTLFILTPKSSDRLSARRGLALTIDGAHLNMRGARLFAETIIKALPDDIY